jgi:hypothetical protein
MKLNVLGLVLAGISIVGCTTSQPARQPSSTLPEVTPALLGQIGVAATKQAVSDFAPENVQNMKCDGNSSKYASANHTYHELGPDGSFSCYAFAVDSGMAVCDDNTRDHGELVVQGTIMPDGSIRTSEAANREPCSKVFLNKSGKPVKISYP